MRVVVAAIVVLLIWATVVQCATDAIHQEPLPSVTSPARHR